MALAEGAGEVHEFELSDELKGIPEYLNQFLPRNGLNWRKLSSSVTVAPISVGETRYELALHKFAQEVKPPFMTTTASNIPLS